MKKWIALLILMVGVSGFSDTEFCGKILALNSTADHQVDEAADKITLDTVMKLRAWQRGHLGVNRLLSHGNHLNRNTWVYQGEEAIAEIRELFEDRVAAADKSARRYKRVAVGAAYGGAAIEVVTGIMNLIFGTPENQVLFNWGYVGTAGATAAVSGGSALMAAAHSHVSRDAQSFVTQLENQAPGTFVTYSLDVQIPETFKGFGELGPLPYEADYTFTRNAQVDIVVERREGQPPVMTVFGSTYFIKRALPSDRSMAR